MGCCAELTGLPTPSLPRRGQIRFVRKGPQRCSVKLTISYEVPSAMAPFASVGAVCQLTGCGAARDDASDLSELPVCGAQRQRQTSPLSGTPHSYSQLLTPIVEGILQTDMQRFADYALKHRASAQV